MVRWLKTKWVLTTASTRTSNSAALHCQPVMRSVMALNKMTYSHFEHRHNFAVWCGARAVQRNFTKTPILKCALEKCGVVEFVKENENKNISQSIFDKHHEIWCESVIETWEKDKIKGASYGRAAKLIAVYIKSMIVVQNVQSKLSNVAHPPIDRIILQNISKDTSINHPNRPYWKARNWTKLDKAQYMNLICDFRKVFDGQPFWQLEKYWTITND